MEIRRVQLTGGSSYVLTLPKEWIKSTNVKKSDSLGITIQPNGTLLITPKTISEKKQRIKEFKLNEKTNQTYLLRKLIGAYISGYNSIQLKSSNRISTPLRASVRKFTQTTIGQEVVEETDTSVILKDLLNPTEMPFTSTIKRMHIIVKVMLEDAIRSLETNNQTLAEDVLIRDNDVDRLHWLIARQYNIILHNINIAEKMNITIGMSSTCFLISRIIERIGDHVVRIAKKNIDILDNKLDKRTIKHIGDASNLALNIFNKSINSFFRKDIKAANENIESVKKLEKQCEEISTLALKKESAVAISVGYIIESIRRIGEYAEDISETVINYLVSEETK